MNRRQKEVQQTFLNSEKTVLKALEKNYQDALNEIDNKIAELQAREDADLQHVIYQIDYQRALKSQVQTVLDQLHNRNFDTLSEYLTSAYEDGFIGTMYDLQGQGIPLVFPIDQAQVAAAIQHETKLSESLYSRLGKDTSVLSRQIAGEISRGITNASMYSDISRNISDYCGISKNKAMRIARTESHRIQCKATADAQHRAKEKGADVVKQWDSSLDGKTRETHRELDGQIRELDDPFEVQGMKAMQPGGFGIPSEDCNCRCALLQRARWALGNDYTKWSPDAPTTIDDDGTTQFVKVKALDYNDFKGKYKEICSNPPKIKDFERLEKYFDKKYNISVDESVKNLDFETCKNVLSGVEYMFKDFPDLADNISSVSTSNSGVMCCNGKTISFNPKYFKDTHDFKELCDKCSEVGFWVKNSSPASVGVHETAHAVESFIIKSNPAYEFEFERTMAWNDCTEAKKIVSQACKNIKKTPSGKGKKNAEIIRGISQYATDSASETMAEAFADVYANGDNAQELSKEIRRLTIETVEKYKGGTSQ